MNWGLFSLCFFFSVFLSLSRSLLISYFGFFPLSFILIDWNREATWQISVVTHTQRNGNNSKKRRIYAKLLRAFYWCVCVRVCVCVSLNWPFKMKWKETDIIIAKFFGSFHMWLANIYLEFWSFTILPANIFLCIIFFFKFHWLFFLHFSGFFPNSKFGQFFCCYFKIKSQLNYMHLLRKQKKNSCSPY